MLYKENIKQSDIEKVELLDKFPNKRAICSLLLIKLIKIQPIVIRR